MFVLRNDFHLSSKAYFLFLMKNISKIRNKKTISVYYENLFNSTYPIENIKQFKHQIKNTKLKIIFKYQKKSYNYGTYFNRNHTIEIYYDSNFLSKIKNKSLISCYHIMMESTYIGTFYHELYHAHQYYIKYKKYDIIYIENILDFFILPFSFELWEEIYLDLCLISYKNIYNFLKLSIISAYKKIDYNKIYSNYINSHIEVDAYFFQFFCLMDLSLLNNKINTMDYITNCRKGRFWCKLHDKNKQHITKKIYNLYIEYKKMNI